MIQIEFLSSSYFPAENTLVSKTTFASLGLPHSGRQSTKSFFLERKNSAKDNSHQGDQMGL
jgi:hypothetical protein